MRYRLHALLALSAALVSLGACAPDPNAPPEATCGDGVVSLGEVCDGSALQGATCESLGHLGGTLGCEADCLAFDEAACTVCGDGVVGPGEVCDGADLAGESCVSQGHPGGSLGCAADCLAFDEAACTVCGDGVVGLGEACDGVDLAGESCVSLGFPGGTLGCAADCLAFDEAGCSVCGDGEVGPGEDCDGPVSDGLSCTDLGHGAGALACTEACRFDTTDCSTCGDGVVEGREVCDGADLAGQTCADLGADGGTLACADDCTAVRWVDCTWPECSGCGTACGGCGAGERCAADLGTCEGVCGLDVQDEMRLVLTPTQVPLTVVTTIEGAQARALIRMQALDGTRVEQPLSTLRGAETIRVPPGEYEVSVTAVGEGSELYLTRRTFLSIGGPTTLRHDWPHLVRGRLDVGGVPARDPYSRAASGRLEVESLDGAFRLTRHVPMVDGPLEVALPAGSYRVSLGANSYYGSPTMFTGTPRWELTHGEAPVLPLTLRQVTGEWGGDVEWVSLRTADGRRVPSAPVNASGEWTAFLGPDRYSFHPDWAPFEVGPDTTTAPQRPVEESFPVTLTLEGQPPGDRATCINVFVLSAPERQHRVSWVSPEGALPLVLWNLEADQLASGDARIAVRGCLDGTDQPFRVHELEGWDPRSGVLDVPRPAPQEVTLTLAGTSLPDAAEGRGQLSFHRTESWHWYSAQVPLPASGDATVAVHLQPGTYEVSVRGASDGPLPPWSHQLASAMVVGEASSRAFDLPPVAPLTVRLVDSEGAPRVGNLTLDSAGFTRPQGLGLVHADLQFPAYVGTYDLLFSGASSGGEWNEPPFFVRDLQVGPEGEVLDRTLRRVPLTAVLSPAADSYSGAFLPWPEGMSQRLADVTSSFPDPHGRAGAVLRGGEVTRRVWVQPYEVRFVDFHFDTALSCDEYEVVPVEVPTP